MTESELINKVFDDPVVIYPNATYEWRRYCDESFKCLCCPRKVIVDPGGYDSPGDREYFESLANAKSANQPDASGALAVSNSITLGESERLQEPIRHFNSPGDREFWEDNQARRVRARAASSTRTAQIRQDRQQRRALYTYFPECALGKCDRPHLRYVFHLHFTGEALK